MAELDRQGNAVGSTAVLFSFLLVLLSNFGNTSFISLFVAGARQELGISHSFLGGLYAGASLAAGLGIVWLGRYATRVDARLFALAAGGALSLGCLGVATAPAWPALAVALALLRLAGPGLMVHVAYTNVVRRAGAKRGLPLMLISLGYPAGEAVMPWTGITLMARLGWRVVWLTVAMFLALALPLATSTLLRDETRRNAEGSEVSRPSLSKAPSVLRDLRFYMMLPAAMAPMLILNGLFFHQVHLATSKGWSIALLGAAFVVYAIAKLLGLGAAWWMIDQIGAVRALPIAVLPFVLGLAIYALSDAGWAAYGYMFGVGLTGGIRFTIDSALWAEIYGNERIAETRSTFWALLTMAMAASPVLMGHLIDRGTSARHLALAAIAFSLAATALYLASGVAGQDR